MTQGKISKGKKILRENSEGTRGKGPKILSWWCHTSCAYILQQWIMPYMIMCACLVARSCLTHCDPMDCSPLGSSVHGISQARILEWVAISFSRGSFWPRDWTWVSCIGRQILYHWATRKAHYSIYYLLTCYFDFNFFLLLKILKSKITL